MELWREILDFPGYSVSNEGHVRNDRDGRLMALLLNQQGLVNVGLTRRRVQHKRSVALLVATAWIVKHPLHQATFDTPINLDGNRLNNCVVNLLWRPRWFAVKYNQQFHNDFRGFTTPIEEVNTGERFKDSWDAATRYGLIEKEIFLATLNRTYVWPTYQRFRVLEDADIG